MGSGLRVVVSIPPLAGLVEPMLPAGSEVEVLVPAGTSPHTFEPTPGIVASVARADLVVMVGMDLEPGVSRLVASGRVGSGTEVLVFADAVGVEAHDHEAGHVHADGTVCFGSDAHLWLDAEMCVAFVPAIASAVERVAGARGVALGDLDGRRDAAIAAIRAADAEAASVLGAWRGARVITHHDAYRRYLARYGLAKAAVVQPVESAEPTPGQVADAVRAVEGSGAMAVFIEPQYPSSAATRVAEVTGVPVGVLDALGDGDWASMYVGLARSIAETLEVSPVAVPVGGVGGDSGVGAGG